MKSFNDILQETIQEQKLLTEVVIVENAYYKLLEYKKDGLDKILYINKYDTNEITSWKWLGYLFGFTDLQFKRLIEGNTIEDIPMFTSVKGKFSIIKIVKNIGDLKVLDSGTVTFNANLFSKSIINNFKGSKYFKGNDELKLHVQFLTKTVLIPFIGPIFWNHYAIMSKEIKK